MGFEGGWGEGWWGGKKIKTFVSATHSHTFRTKALPSPAPPEPPASPSPLGRPPPLRLRHRLAQSERRSRVNSSCGSCARASGGDRAHRGAPADPRGSRPLLQRGPTPPHPPSPRRRWSLNDTSSPTVKSDLQRQMRKWPPFNWIFTVAADKSGGSNGKMGRSDVAKKAVRPLSRLPPHPPSPSGSDCELRLWRRTSTPLAPSPPHTEVGGKKILIK